MKKQAEKFFLEKLNGCYKVINKKYPNSIFWFYDKQIIRQKKLCKILGEGKIGVFDDVGFTGKYKLVSFITRSNISVSLCAFM